MQTKHQHASGFGGAKAPISAAMQEIYHRAAQILIARPEYRKMMALSDAGERRRRRAELRTLYPEADQWYEWKRLKRQRGG